MIYRIHKIISLIEYMILHCHEYNFNLTLMLSHAFETRVQLKLQNFGCIYLDKLNKICHEMLMMYNLLLMV